MTGGIHYYTEKAAASCPSMLATPMYASLSSFYITNYKLDALQNLVSAGHTSKAQPKLDAILSGHVSAMPAVLPSSGPKMASVAISENIKQERYKGQLYLQAHSGSTVAVYIYIYG